MSSRINNTDINVVKSIRAKTAYALPNRPSEQGYSAEAIKKALAGGLIDSSNSIFAEINRVINEGNDCLEELEQLINNKDKTFIGDTEPNPNDYTIWLDSEENDSNEIINMSLDDDSNEEINVYSFQALSNSGVDENQPIADEEQIQPIADEEQIQPIADIEVDENQPIADIEVDENQPVSENTI